MNKTVTLLLTALLLGACTRAPFLYRKDVAQGNVYRPEDIRQIQPGMERAGVQRLLGTPQLHDPFRPQEDIYLYRYYSGDTRQAYQGRLTVRYNEKNRVINVDNKPTTVIKD